MLQGLFYIEPLSLVMAALIFVISGTVAGFSSRYMDGDAGYMRFFVNLGFLTASALLLVFSNHILFFCAAWALMGLFLSALIGHVKNWENARTAGRIARRYFLVGTAVLATGFWILSSQVGSLYINEVLGGITDIGSFYIWGAGLCFLIAGMIQSALFPFHKWLLCSMTAPTPVSAFMHAGIVNAGGFLIIRLNPLFTLHSELLLVVFAAGAVSAFLGALWMLAQADIKKQLGCSTVSQMGFMILQCGLGFYTAALAHLILHGFYKAYKFLNAGSALEAPKLPQEKNTRFGLASIAMIVLGGLLAGEVFALTTEKSLIALNSGGVLICFVVLAGMTAMTGFAALKEIGPVMRALIGFTAIVFLTGLYAAVYNGLSIMMPVNEFQPLSKVHIITVMVFASSWIYFLSGLFQTSEALYIKSLNAAQPPLGTVLDKRSSYDA